MRVLDERLDAVLAACGLPVGPGWTSERLSEGNYNTVHRLRAPDGPGYVLKVAPEPGAPHLTYERDLMRTEAAFYDRAWQAAPVPRLVHADFGRKVLDVDFLMMTELAGASWHSGRERLTVHRDRLRGDLGRAVAGLHRVTGPGFGYAQLGLRSTWREAFTGMVAAVLADAARFAVKLPRPADHITAAVARHADLFDDVDVPVLVHFDLWEGNVLVDTSGARPELGGLVDGERTFWGDPTAELVSLALFKDIDRAFLDAYREAGGHVEFTAATRLRLACYRVYLNLVMLVETVPRGQTGPTHAPLTRLVVDHLTADLAELTG